jgi:hypothetical protein
LLARLVNDAAASGYNYTTGSGTFTCDVNDPNTTTALTNTPGTAVTRDDVPTVPSPGDEGQPAQTNNPADPLDTVPGPTITGNARQGQTLTAPEFCANGITDWYLIDNDGNSELVSSNTATYLLDANTASNIGKRVYVTTRCPDENAPGGYAPAVQSELTSAITGTPPLNTWTTPAQPGRLVITGTKYTAYSTYYWCPGSGRSGVSQAAETASSAINFNSVQTVIRYRFTETGASPLNKTCGYQAAQSYALDVEYELSNGNILTSSLQSMSLAEDQNNQGESGTISLYTSALSIQIIV